MFPQLLSRLFFPSCQLSLTHSSLKIGSGSCRMLSLPPDARLMQTPEGLLKAEAAGASGMQQGIRSSYPEQKAIGVQVACCLSIVGGQGYGSPMQETQPGHYEEQL